MLQGDKSGYTEKQKHKVEHIAAGDETRGTGRRAVGRRAIDGALRD